MSRLVDRPPRLTARHRTELAGYGATAEQIDAIDRRVAAVAQELRQPWAAGDVSDSLDELATLANRLKSMMDTKMIDGPDGVAWRRLKIELAGAAIESVRHDGDAAQAQTASRKLEPDQLELVQRLVGVADHWVEVLASAAQAARINNRARGRGRPSASGTVVQHVIDALREPSDSRAVTFADGCRPILGRHESANKFPDVLRIVIEAATGARPIRVAAYVTAWSRSEWKWPDGTPEQLR